MRLIITILAGFLVTVHAPTACAQGAPALGQFSDDQVRRILMLALDNIQRGICENNQPCAPTTEAERQNPPITIPEARAIMQRGVVSGAAMHCDMDWGRRNFEPMMAHWRHTMKKNSRQMVTVGFLHGIMQGIAGPQNNAAKNCPDQLRQNLELMLTFKP
jgi:hypothetical protein